MEETNVFESICSNDEAAMPLEVSTCDISESTQRNENTILDGRYFIKLEDKSYGEKIVAKCTQCNGEIKGSLKCTSNFTTHLKRKHGSCLEDYRDYLNEKKKLRNSEVLNSYSQTEFDNDIVKYFVDSMISLRCIENVYFQNIIKNLNSNSKPLQIMSRRSLGRKISICYDEQLESIKNDLAKIEFVCITADIWSGRQRSFLGVTVHWIETQTLNRVSKALACQRFKGIHSYDKIYDLLMNIWQKFELKSTQIVAAITDNGSNFVKAFKVFGIEEKCLFQDISLENDSRSSDCDSDAQSSIKSDIEKFSEENVNDYLPMHFRCASHTLSLCVTTDANKVLQGQNTNISKMHEQVIKKCNILWKAACRPKSAEVIKSILGHTLSRPNETRWNSLYDAMKQIFSIKEKAAVLSTDLNLQCSFKDQDFTYIEEYLKCSKYIAEALDIFQGEKDMYFGILIPTLLSLRHKLQKLLTEDFIYCQPLAKTYLESLTNRFNDYFNFSSPQAEKAAIASLSHPKFLKFKWKSCISKAYFEKIKNIFISEISNEIESNKESINLSCPYEHDFYSIDSSSEEQNETKESNITAELMCSRFFLEETKDLSILNFYKEIRSIFIKYNTPLPSSASVERLFSYASITNYCKANRLSDEMFEKRVVLKANLVYCKQYFKKIFQAKQLFFLFKK